MAADPGNLGACSVRALRADLGTVGDFVLVVARSWLASDFVFDTGVRGARRRVPPPSGGPLAAAAA